MIEDWVGDIEAENDVIEAAGIDDGHSRAERGGVRHSDGGCDCSKRRAEGAGLVLGFVPRDYARVRLLTAATAWTDSGA
jgi:hypothetical protein